MNKIDNYSILILMTLNLFSSVIAHKKEILKVEWRPGINAPRYYPISAVGGGFSDGENYCSITTGGCQYDGWGKGGLEMGTGYFVPDKLSIKWFSYAEDRFFEGSFPLPVETMRALFEQGYKSLKGTKFAYENLIINVYPEGGVAFWMSRGGKRTVEIGHYQAKEIDYDWRSMFPRSFTETREAYNKFVMSNSEGATEYIAKYGINPVLFKTVFRQRYDYTIEIDGVTHAETEQLYFEAFNGEKDTMQGEELVNNFFKTKAVPNCISINWVKDGVYYYGRITFSAPEMFKVFEDMNSVCPDDPYVLYLKPNHGTGKLTAFLRSKTNERKIKTAGRIGKATNQKPQ